MQTVVLAAGEGTRIRPLTANRPKPSLPVTNRSLLAHTLSAAVDAGATSITLVVGYEKDAIVDAIGDEFEHTPVEYVVQDVPRGTAHAVRTAKPTLDDEPFAVLNGDVLYDVDSLETLFESGPAVGSYRVDDPSNYGVLTTADDPSQRVTGVVEKPDDPPSNLINTGSYVFPADAQAWLDVNQSDRGEMELTDVLDRTCAEYDVDAVPFERWLDVGRPWELLEANEWKLEELDTDLRGTVSDDATLRGAVVVEEGAHVKEGVTIEGPALIREGATVGPNAYVRGSTVVGPDARVGHSVEVKNSVLMAGATVGHLSYVGDSILGRDVNFGAGTTVANLRHGDEDVKTVVKGEVTSTNRRKFGVVLGDGAKTGINTTLNAGVMLPAGSRTMPDETILRTPASDDADASESESATRQTD
ncbi:bifunctional sugar-1-phosphate nucleotidylyltransferase/acetyltransferase [Haloplanus natans]|uniref:bifunctional sugar-1-phosphate nucleotidylyltransferase/acetyltransferase n=1 Tax=Haloplanus natans TaxID=376171 RepID=UPI000A06D589|nr:bifunctional sugar-1-phosphate nucleotidylyltransferase/acetyltransferase [Haloplanus natans]